MKILVLFLSLITTQSAFATTEKLQVQKVMSIDDKAIVARPNGEKWLIEVGAGCMLLSSYEGRSVIGEYGIDPSSAGAKLILPDDGSECIIWEGTEIN